MVSVRLNVVSFFCWGGGIYDISISFQWLHEFLGKKKGHLNLALQPASLIRKLRLRPSDAVDGRNPAPPGMYKSL